MVKGRFLATRALYPLQSWDGCDLNFCSVINVALFLIIEELVVVVLVLEEEEEEGLVVTIWAFCFSTSAGVRMKQDTSSAVDEARASRTGIGIKEELCCGRVREACWIRWENLWAG